MNSNHDGFCGKTIAGMSAVPHGQEKGAQASKISSW
jgi:hypothetical protein